MGVPAGRRCRRWAAVLGAALIAGFAAAPTPVTALPVAAAPLAVDPAATPTPVVLTLTEFSPDIPKAADDLTLRGTLTNTSATTWDTASVRLRLSARPLANRSEVAQVAAGTPEVRQTTPVEAAEVQVDGLDPGDAVPWTLKVPLKSLELPGNGVYVVEVEARGQSDAGGDAAAVQVGRLSTFLPFMAKKKQYAPTRVSWLWPLAAAPARDGHGTFTDPALAESLRPGGRLAELASAPGSAPVTWMVDPELLDAAAALSGQHRTRTGTATGTAEPDPDAAAWLADLRSRLTGKPVAALPYADPDVAAMARRGFTEALGPALEQSRRSTATLLGRESDTALAWPADGLATADTLGLLRRAGATAAVLSSEVVAPTEALTYTPTGRAKVPADGGPLPVLVADQSLTNAFVGDLGAPGAAELAARRFLADTAMLTLERPNEARTVLVAPPRRWAPPPGWAADLLAAAQDAPWIRMVPLAALSRLVEAPELAGATAVYPARAAGAELGAGQVRRVGEAAEAAAAMESVLARPGGLEVGYRAALLRSLSSHWRADPAGGRAYVNALGDTIRADRGKVRVIGRNLVNLSSNSGTIPITVSNDLAQSVLVVPVVAPKVGSRLRVTPTEAIEIGPGRKSTVRVEAEASANGITRVGVRLHSADGKPFGPTIDLRVNATSYGNLGLLVVGSAAGLLFLAAGVRNVRRFRNRNSAPPPGPDGPAPPGRGPGPGPDSAGRGPALDADEKVQA